MPRTIEIDGRPMQVATEGELLAFANAIRQAGGADVINALLPSRPSSPRKCLIATALNFGCSVAPSGKYFKDGTERWRMSLPGNLTVEQRKALDNVKGVRLRHHKPDEYESADYYFLTLPKPIGNAALAFDEGTAFQSFSLGPWA